MMTASWKGILVGACNAIACAAVIGIMEASPHHVRAGREAFVAVAFFSMMPALATGAALGRLTDYLTRFRRTIVTALALAAVVMFGAMMGPSYIEVCCVPTVAAALVLEYWTRRPGALTSTWKGAYLGFANVVAVALLVGVTLALDPTAENFDKFGFGFVSRNTPPLVVAFVIFTIGMMPGLVMGAIVGRLAQALATRRPALRVALLDVVALGQVAFLGVWTANAQVVFLAAMPTLVAIFVLERWTRRVADELPEARALPLGR